MTEAEAIKQIQARFPNVKPSKYEYSRFDAYSHEAIFEVKIRRKHYATTLIEFDKLAYNLQYAIINKKSFFYVVFSAGGMYLFDVRELMRRGHDFKLHWKELPENTDFGSKKKRFKYVGYIDFKQAIRFI